MIEPDVPEGKVREACTSVGMAKYATPLDLEDKITVDLIVVGSTAVCPETGARIGKGEGFAELEYGMLRWMGAGNVGLAWIAWADMCLSDVAREHSRCQTSLTAM